MTLRLKEGFIDEARWWEQTQWDEWDVGKKGKHYDFVEVGTSDWCTLTQYCAGDTVNGSWTGYHIRSSLDDLSNARGIAVDVI